MVLPLRVWEYSLLGLVLLTLEALFRGSIGEAYEYTVFIWGLID